MAVILAASLCFAGCDQVKSFVNNSSESASHSSYGSADSATGATTHKSSTSDAPDAQKAQDQLLTDEICKVIKASINKCLKAETVDEVNYIARSMRTDLNGITIPEGLLNDAQKAQIKQLEGEFIDVKNQRIEELTQ